MDVQNVWNLKGVPEKKLECDFCARGQKSKVENAKKKFARHTTK